LAFLPPTASYKQASVSTRDTKGSQDKEHLGLHLQVSAWTAVVFVLYTRAGEYQTYFSHLSTGDFEYIHQEPAYTP